MDYVKPGINHATTYLPLKCTTQCSIVIDGFSSELSWKERVDWYILDLIHHRNANIDAWEEESKLIRTMNEKDEDLTTT